MLPPRDTATRERKSLGGLWRFLLDVEGRGRSERWWERPLTGAREIPVPSSYNDLFPEEQVHDHVGDAWYETTVRVPFRIVPGDHVVYVGTSADHTPHTATVTRA